jgi:hypothetical protein
LKKLTKVNNRPIGENSHNLVALSGSSSNSSSKSMKNLSGTDKLRNGDSSESKNLS